MSLSCSLLHTGGSIRFKGNQKCALVCRLPQRQHISACLELSKGLCTGSQLQSGREQFSRLCIHLTLTAARRWRPSGSGMIKAR